VDDDGARPAELNGFAREEALPTRAAALLRRSRALLRDPPDPRVSILAVDLCRRAQGEAPGHPAVTVALAQALHLNGRCDEAAAVCEAALEARPEAVELRLEQLLVTVPTVYAEVGEAARTRAEYAARLEALERHLAQAPAAELARLAAAAPQFFSYWLPYQAQDDAALQRRLGRLLQGALAGTWPDVSAACPVPSVAGPLRVGFVSSHFREHTIWHVILRGWLAGLSARGFACHCYSIGSGADECTALARRDSARFVEGPLSLPDWADLIRGDRLHALVYPALGYSRRVDALALMRLAPVQCCTFGHCVTSGSPAMDHFLSSELMEPDDGERHYTERLVRLPDLALSYPATRGGANTRGRRHPGLRPDAVLFVSPHPPKKYLPEDDALYARIAERTPRSQVVFFRHPRLAAASVIHERRLHAAFVARGLDPGARLVFLDTLERADYLSLLESADVYLDVPGWNGGTTSAEALARGVPMVTLQGDLARSRMGAAMLRHVGVTDGLAASADEYVDLAAGLGHDAAHRGDVRRRLAAAAGRISDDTARLDGLAEFLEGAVRAAAQAAGG